MDGKIEVNMSELDKIADRIEVHLQNFVSYVNQLYTKDINRLSFSWSNAGNKQYIEAFQDYLEDLKKLGDSIGDYIAYLHMAADNYENALSDSVLKTK